MQGIINTEMNSNDLNISELYWIKACQKTLVQDAKFEQWKVQFGLHLDDAGVWRCKGRLGCADLPEDTKYPMLLPSGHYFTTLLVLHCHQRVKHGGIKETLTELRHDFGLPKDEV